MAGKWRGVEGTEAGLSIEGVSSGEGLPGLVATTSSRSLSRASGERGFEGVCRGLEGERGLEGVFAPLDTSVLQLSSRLARPCTRLPQTLFLCKKGG